MNPAGQRVDAVILVADGLVYEGVDYAHRIEGRLATAGLTSARFDLTGAPGAQPPSARAYILTGGTTSVHSDERWMRSAVDLARRLITTADQEQFSMIGICLGSQILAEALRPDSIISSKNIEVGLATIERTGDALAQQVVPAFHYQVTSPAIAEVDGVRIEWHNAHTAVQGFGFGKRVFGYQFHPELSAGDVHNLIDYNRDVIAAWGGDVAIAHQSVEEGSAALKTDLFDRTVVDCIF